MTKFISSEFVRYVIAGGINTVLGYIAYLLLLPLIAYTTAYTVTYIGGIALAYYLNSRFVFRQPLHWKKAFQFPLVYIVQYLAAILLLFVLVKRLKISEVLAPAVVIACTVPLTFILSRLIIKGRGTASSKGEPSPEKEGVLMSFWKQARAFMLPIMVTLVIPAVLYLGSAVNLGWGFNSPWNLLTIAAGIILMGLGLLLLVKTISMFITIGQGTLAPWDPTHKLVVHGIYQYVRNPMITGVFCLVLGEAVLLGSSTLLIWSLLVALVNLIYIPLSEEPGLVDRFGDDYLLYKQNVPRWIPRLQPWTALADQEGKETE